MASGELHLPSKSGSVWRGSFLHSSGLTFRILAGFCRGISNSNEQARGVDCIADVRTALTRSARAGPPTVDAPRSPPARRPAHWRPRARRCAKTAIVNQGTAATGTAPRLVAKAFQTTRPTTMPSGTPTTMPTRATVRGLPEHGRADLPVHKAERLEESHLPAAPDDADHEQMEESRHAEQPPAHNPRMSGKFTASPKLTNEVGTVGRFALSSSDVAGDIGLAPRTGGRLRQDDEVLTGREFLSASVLFTSGRTQCVQVAGHREGRAGAESAPGFAGERRRPDDAKWHACGSRRWAIARSRPRTDPTWAPTWCRVVAPSVMSWSPVGSRPSTVERSMWPTHSLPGNGEDVMPLDRHLIGGRQHDRR